jgi:heavy metal sensor kinase
MSSKTRDNFWSRLDVRLTIYYTSIFLAFAIILCSFFFYRLSHNLLKQIDRILMDGTIEFINSAHNSEQDLLQTCLGAAKDIPSRKYYPLYFRVLRADGSIFFEPGFVRNFSPSPFESKRTPVIEILQLFSSEHPFRHYNKIFSLRSGGKYSIQMAVDIQRIKLTLRNLLENILIVIPVLLLLSIGWGLYALKQYREIIGNIVNVTNRITSNYLQERLPVPPVSDELQHLIITINLMIDRIEQAVREVKQFTADVSHELRTPLFALKGEFEVALTQNRGEGEYREAIAESLERINFLIKMVNDLLLISRFDERKMDLELKPLSLGEIVRGLYDFFLPMAQEKKQRFSVAQCDDVMVTGDRTRMHQLFSNLIDNAVKFTPEGGSIELFLEVSGGQVRFRVRDSGIGIIPEDMSNIFDRFYQGDKSRSGKPRGSGLGLHICKRIVEAHGGSIAVAGNPGRGVTFTVTLPPAGFPAGS